MDFLEILKNSSNSTDDNIKQKDKQKPKITKNYDNSQLNTNYNDNSQLNTNYNDNSQLNTISTYKNIKKGDFIKIIYQKNSILNQYKGYFGEIKEYRKEQDSALIFLHAISVYRLIKFPITHFIKIN
jgi:hypothetical protein